ncbi:MAG TPA: VCBS repeat-containing protein [Polyangiaceae bacterium]|nr:VCBS repeat-containing protein [Polyangiaceae bacterium]
MIDRRIVALLGGAVVSVVGACGNEGSSQTGPSSSSATGGGGDAAGTGGSGAVSDSSSQGGSNGAMRDAADDGNRITAGGCSEMPARTGPPAGKEAFQILTSPDAHFPFTKHWVGIFSDDPRFVSSASLTDLDNDGDLDFAIAQQHRLTGGANWYEYCGPDHWVKHHVGNGHRSVAAGGAFDVDADGFVDILVGDSWYRNPKTPRTAGDWQRFVIKPAGALTGDLSTEELIVGDINNDKKGDALWLHTGLLPQWWTPGSDATQEWTTGTRLTTDVAKIQRQGGAIGDIDGDGKNDVLVGREWWYRNVNGDGMMWEAIHIDPGADFTDEPLTYLGDLDGDMDTDIAMITHWGGEAGATVAWFENTDKIGKAWTRHDLATGKGWLHDVVAADFDNDGDLDIFVGKNVGPQWIWENTGDASADKTKLFVEHTVSGDWRGHEARVGDVDCDGDLDIVGKPWGDPNEGGEGSNPPRDVVYLQNMFVEKSGKPVFDRPNWITFNQAPPLTCKR